MFINEPSWPNVRIVKSILETYQRTGNIHHAYLIEGEPRRLLPKVLEIVEEISGESSSANPDVYLVRVPKFLIDEARDIREKAWRRPFGRGPKFFVISAQSLTVEAAQALLKIFEDPPSRTHFFLLVPSLSVVMPTLRSRFFVISSANQFPFGSRKSLPLAKEFLGSSPAERFKIGEEFEKVGLYSDAVQCFVQANNHEKLAVLGGKCLRNGHLKDAMTAFSATGDTDNLNRVGTECIEKNKLDYAIEIFGMTGNSEQLIHVGKKCMDQKKYASSVKAFALADDRDGLNLVGDVCLRENLVNTALKAYENAQNEAMVAFVKSNFVSAA